jgi:hypothetical protein
MKTPLSRRTFLRASGVAMGLPLLNSMVPTLRAADKPADIRRFVAFCAPLGIHTPNLFPKAAGRDYDLTPYLRPLEGLREKFTITSGLMHPEVDGGHTAENSYLTGAAHPASPSFRNSISVDQFAAERLGHHTRLASLTLSVNNNGLGFTRSGIRIPAEQRPSRLFAKLFLEGTVDQKKEQMRRIKDGQSVMDLVRDQTQALGRRIGRQDHQTLDHYFTSVRETEKRLVKAEEWARKPKPRVDYQKPTDINDRANLTGRMELMYDMIFLALQTDSTRFISCMGPGGAEVVSLKGVDDGWHNLSHHSKSADKIKMLGIIEHEEFRLFGNFLQRLDAVKEGANTLLDQTAIMMGSHMGNASSHNNSNLPIIAAGGHFRHGQHLAFNPRNPPPLCNLLVSYLQHLGLETDTFSTGKSTLSGLESA